MRLGSRDVTANWGLCAALCAAAVAASCGADKSVHAADAGLDATTADDASLDAATDAPPDAAGPDDPGWVQLPGFPDRCRMERAERPELVFAPNWQPCPDVDGCRMLVQDEPEIRRYDTDLAGHDGVQGYFGVVRVRNERHRAQYILAAADAPPVAAWRASTDDLSCIFSPRGLARDASAAFFVYTLQKDDGTYEHRVYHAPLAEIGAVTEPVVVMGEAEIPGRARPREGDVSTSTIALYVGEPSFIQVIEDGQVHRMEASPDEGGPFAPMVVGRDVLWSDTSSRTSMVHGSLLRPTDVYLDPLTFDAIDVYGASTDGRDVAWLLGHGVFQYPPYVTVELWTSPYAEDPAGLAPRVVREVPGEMRGALAGPGRYALVQERKIVLIDLATAEWREVDLPEPYTAKFPLLWATDQELAVASQDSGDQPPTVFRIELAAMTIVPPEL